MRPTSKCHGTLIRAQRGRSDVFFANAFDLPGRAEFKVASHCLIGAATPPRRRGKYPYPDSNSFTRSPRLFSLLHTIPTAADYYKYGGLCQRRPVLNFLRTLSTSRSAFSTASAAFVASAAT